MILVSHDPRLIAAVCDRLWLVAEGTCKPFAGDLADYRRLVAEERKAADRPSREARAESPSARDVRRAAADARLRLKPLRDAAEAAERELDRLHREKAALQATLADPAVYETAPERVREAARKLAEVDRGLEAAEDAWLKAHSALEQGAANES